MRSTWKIAVSKLAVAWVVFGYFGACAPVKFEKAPPAPCGGNGVVCVQKCEGDSCIQDYTVKRTVGDALVDILIVNDNSGSMSTEQMKMGDRFPTFLQSLGDVNYRIGMITTDVSKKEVKTSDGRSLFMAAPGSTTDDNSSNGFGSLQDGKFVSFASGIKFLTRDTPSKESLFYNTIKRNETVLCEQSGYSQCPSSDERGVFAANLALDRMASEGFTRPLAHMAVIVLSDEDERGLSDARSVKSTSDETLRQMYPIEEKDKPEVFVNNFRSKFPGKTLSVHSIIVKPGDSNCLMTQTSQGAFVRGVEGYTYAALSQMTGGQIGTICASDYGAQLTNIGYQIQNQVTSLPFACRPVNDEFEVQFDPQPTQDIDVTADFGKMQLNINDPVPPMTSITLTYQCSKAY